MSLSLPSPSLDESFLDSLIFNDSWNHILARRRIALLTADRKRKLVAISEQLNHGRHYNIVDRASNVDRSFGRFSGGVLWGHTSSQFFSKA